MHLNTELNLLTAAGSILIGYGVARFGASLFSELKNVLFSRVAQGAIRTLSKDTFNHLHTLDHGFHVNRQTGAIARSLDRGNKGLSFLMTAVVFHIIPTIVEISMVSGLLYLKCGWSYALISIGTMALYTAYTLAITSWRTRFRKQMNSAENKSANRIFDSLLNHESVKAFNTQSSECNRLDSHLKDYEDAALKTSSSLCYLNVGQNAIFSLALSSVMYMACGDIANGVLSIGDLVMVNGLIFQLSLPLNFLGSVYRELRQSIVDMESLFAIRNVEPAIKALHNCPHLRVSKGDIKFENVSFGYKDNNPLLQNLSFKIESGQRIAFVGPSGCGKSTIVKLLERFYDPQSGMITIDGHDISKVDLNSLRTVFGYVSQDVSLFNDTILYNISYGSPLATKEDVIEAAKKACIHDLIMSLPKQYDTVVGERGLSLSGGEKQRIAIARVFLKNPKIFLLDEATASLDSTNELNIMSNIYQSFRDRTVIVVAHRLSTIKDSDMIFVLDKGSIIERGCHSELLERRGLYHSLWQSQHESK